MMARQLCTPISAAASSSKRSQRLQKLQHFPEKASHLASVVVNLTLCAQACPIQHVETSCIMARHSSLYEMQALVLQASGLSGLQDLRLAMFLLLVSRIMKDRGALKSIGGPGVFVQMLEDDNARMRHTAAAFLQVCEKHNTTPICSHVPRSSAQQTLFSADLYVTTEGHTVRARQNRP